MSVALCSDKLPACAGRFERGTAADTAFTKLQRRMAVMEEAAAEQMQLQYNAAACQVARDMLLVSHTTLLFSSKLTHMQPLLC